METTNKAAETAKNENGTVNRILRLLSCFAEKDRWGLNELARALNLPRGSAHRLLGLCKPLSFVSQNAEGQYIAGIELYRLSARLAENTPINSLVEPILRNVRDKTDETALLTVLLRSELKMFFSLSASPNHPLRYSIQKNLLQPLTWGASGRSLLAFLTEAEVEETISRGEPSPLDGRSLDPDELRSSLRTIREQGYSLTYAQRSPETYGIAIPFFDASGSVAGNINLAIPQFRFDSGRLDFYLEILGTATADISRGLGCNGVASK